MEDYVIRATAGNGSVRAFAASTGNMVNDARKVHDLSPLAAVALGRTMTAAAMMAVSMKGEKDTLTIQIKGDGPLGGIVVVSDSNLNVRGYVHNPKTYLPLNDKGKFDVAGAVGKGYLNIIRDLGLREPYIGYVKLMSGEIAEDMAYYFTISEQIPSAVSLGVYVDADETIICAGGYILQLMPEADEEIISYLEKKVAEQPPVTSLIASGKSPEDILGEMLGEIGLKINDRVPCRFKCNCSRERMERGLVALGADELRSLIKEQKGAEVQCHFCNAKYDFTEKELTDLLNSLEEPR